MDTRTEQRAAARPPASLRQAWVALSGLSAVFLFEMLDTSILNVALPTIGRDLGASTVTLQWVTNAYAVVFGGLMLAFGAVADRLGRRRVMLAGLLLLGGASLATVFVTNAAELVAVRVVTGLAAAMTAPGAMALAFRLFEDERLRVRAITLISTVGLVGLAIGPTLGGLVLAVAPWQVLLLLNVPVAVLALIGIGNGIAADDPAELHRDPPDVLGAGLGTAAVGLALVAPTLFVDVGTGSWAPWAATATSLIAVLLFVARQRRARYPLLDLTLLARPLVGGGLAYKAAAGLATAGLGYLVTLQLQLDWGWPPALAAVGMLPQVIVLVAGGPLVNRFIERVGVDRAGWLSATAVVLGLACYAALGSASYVFVAVGLALVAAGMRVVGVVAGFTVLKGLPQNRTSIGAAVLDTVSQVSAATGIAVTGTVLAALFVGSVATSPWTAAQSGQFHAAVTLSGGLLAVVAAVLVGWAVRRAHAGTAS